VPGQAAGSSLLQRLTCLLATDALRLAGLPEVPSHSSEPQLRHAWQCVHQTVQHNRVCTELLRSQVGTVTVLPVATGLAMTMTLLALRTTLTNSDARWMARAALMMPLL
jgi:hypothetical protein